MPASLAIVQSVFADGSREPLEWGKAIATKLEAELFPIEITRHPDQELYFVLPDNLPKRVIAVATIYRRKPNVSLMAFAQVVHALKWHGAKEVIGILPYFPYSRQDRVDKKGAPITSKWVVEILEASGIDKVVLVDPHEEQLAGYFNVPTLFVPTAALWADVLTQYVTGKYEIVSPDMGMVKRLVPLLAGVGHTADLLVVFKKRESARDITSFGLNREPRFDKAVIIDDIVASGNTLRKAASFLRNQGVEDVYAAVTHPVLTKGALEVLNSDAFTRVFLGNTIYALGGDIGDSLGEKIEVIDLSGRVIDYMLEWGFV